MRRLNIILSIVLLLVCVFFYFMIFQLPEDVTVYPIFVVTVLTILTLILLFKTYFNKEEDKETNVFENIKIKQMLFVLITSGIYVALINFIGYIVSTVLYVLTALIGLKVGKKSSVFITCGFCLFLYIVFKILLKVPLPKGFII